MPSPIRRLAAALVLALALAGTADAAQAAKGPEHHDGCFLSRDWDGWTVPAAGQGDVLYLRVRQHDIYRVDLTPGTRAHKSPGYFLVTRVRGSNWICDAVDLDLTISDDLGFRQPLIVRKLRRLTPAEIAAIPRKDLP